MTDVSSYLAANRGVSSLSAASNKVSAGLRAAGLISNKSPIDRLLAKAGLEDFQEGGISVPALDARLTAAGLTSLERMEIKITLRTAGLLK